MQNVLDKPMNKLTKTSWPYGNIPVRGKGREKIFQFFLPEIPQYVLLSKTWMGTIKNTAWKMQYAQPKMNLLQWSKPGDSLLR